MKKKLQSIRYALTGLGVAWREQHNFRFHVLIAAVVLFSAWLFGLSRIEGAIIVAMIGLVLAAEIINTALEELCDAFRSEQDPHIAKIKDLAAAAVLVASCTALLAGLAIFTPHVAAFFGV